MGEDTNLIKELRAVRYLLSMAILWGVLCMLCGSVVGPILALGGFLLVGGAYLAGPSRHKD